MSQQETETIAAIATPPGRGGVGIVRVSGSQASDIAKVMLGGCPKPRYATYTDFLSQKQETIDSGIALYFKAPHSFTGEDVLELQAHGGPVVLDQLLKTVVRLGARLARPGEFSERAYHNDKLDLTQAEAISDLINANTEAAAQSAMHSLQGEFSQQIDSLLTELIQLRMMVEAAIDFPEEEIDFLADSTIVKDLRNLLARLQQVEQAAKQGVLLQAGIQLVLAGKPNAGKSSLLNCLTGEDSAIVTDIAGTTRDTVKQSIQIDGVPVHVIDTAGLRETDNTVEKIGVERAIDEAQKADIICVVVDASENLSHDIIPAELKTHVTPDNTVVVFNKMDLVGEKPECSYPSIYLSTKTLNGLNNLKQHILKAVGFDKTLGSTFTARRRHLVALEKTQSFIQHGLEQLEHHKAGELLAEDLRQAQQHLSEITGVFSADDLLGEIFSSFCIGK